MINRDPVNWELTVYNYIRWIFTEYIYFTVWFSGVNSLYRDFHRELEYTCRSHMLYISVATAKEQLRKEFLKNKDVTDIRVIDLHVVKGIHDFYSSIKNWIQIKIKFLGRQTLEEMHHMWSQDYNIMAYFDETEIHRTKTAEKSATFMDKFLKSSD